MAKRLLQQESQSCDLNAARSDPSPEDTCILKRPKLSYQVHGTHPEDLNIPLKRVVFRCSASLDEEENGIVASLPEKVHESILVEIETRRARIPAGEEHARKAIFGEFVGLFMQTYRLAKRAIDECIDGELDIALVPTDQTTYSAWSRLDSPHESALHVVVKALKENGWKPSWDLDSNRRAICLRCDMRQ